MLICLSLRPSQLRVEKRLEDVKSILFCYANSLIYNFDLYTLISLWRLALEVTQYNLDLRVRQTVFDCVSYEIYQNLLHSHLVEH